MSWREKGLIIVVLGLVLLFGLDRLVLAPTLDSLDTMQAEITRLERRLAEARTLVDSRDRITSRWSAYRQAGLGRDVERARLHAQEQLATWSRDTGVNLQSLSTGRVVSDEQFHRITFTTSATGRLDQVQRFLWELRQADFPLRVLNCDLSTRGDADNRLNLSLTLSTMVWPDPEGSDPQQATDGGGS